jgi:DNA invertase Pin-like site-specific DNA recombinase
MGPNIGYIRVSTVDQNTDRQLDGIHLDQRFEDKVSGSSTKRPKLKECLNFLRSGDTLHVHSMDRLARNLKDLQSIVEGLTAKGITVKFHKENLEFTDDSNAMSKLMLQIMGAVAEFERSLIRERQAEGIQKAKQKGKHLGRKATLNDVQVYELCQMVTDGIQKKDVADHFGISRQTLYRILKGQQDKG